MSIFSPNNQLIQPDSPSLSPSVYKPRRLASFFKLMKAFPSEQKSAMDVVGSNKSGEKSQEIKNRTMSFAGRIPLPFCRVDPKKLGFKKETPKQIQYNHISKKGLADIDTRSEEEEDSDISINLEKLMSPKGGILPLETLSVRHNKTNSDGQTPASARSKRNNTTDTAEEHNLSKFGAQRRGTTGIANIMKNNTDLDNLTNEELITLAIEILKKPPDLRNIIEIKILRKCMEAVQFFKTYDQKTIEDCLRHMFFVPMKAGDVVFEFGTEGTTFYVTLVGSVGVIVNLDFVVGKNDDGTEKKEKRATEVRVLPAGSAFGEIALTENKPRSATIKCKEDCVFAVLDKESFNNILKAKEQKKLFDQINFLCSFPLLKMLPYHLVHWVVYNTEITRTTRGNVIYEEGDRCMSMFLIRSGEFKILRTIENESEFSTINKNPLEKVVKRSLGNQLVEIAILGVKESFGEEELLSPGCTKRRFKVVCSSAQGEITEVPRDKLEKLMKNDVAREWIRNLTEAKERHYNERIRNIQATRNEKKNYTIIDKKKSKNLIKVQDPTYIPTPTATKKIGEFEMYETPGVALSPNNKRATPKIRTVLIHRNHLQKNSSPDIMNMTQEPEAKLPPGMTKTLAKTIKPVLAAANNVIGHDSGRSALARSKSEANYKGQRPEMNPEDGPVKLSLMRAYLDQHKAKKRPAKTRQGNISRQMQNRRDPSPRRGDPSPRKNTGDLSGTNLTSEKRETSESVISKLRSVTEPHSGNFIQFKDVFNKNTPYIGNVDSVAVSIRSIQSKIRENSPVISQRTDMIHKNGFSTNVMYERIKMKNIEKTLHHGQSLAAEPKQEEVMLPILRKTVSNTLYNQTIAKDQIELAKAYNSPPKKWTFHSKSQIGLTPMTNESHDGSMSLAHHLEINMRRKYANRMRTIIGTSDSSISHFSRDNSPIKVTGSIERANHKKSPTFVQPNSSGSDEEINFRNASPIKTTENWYSKSFTLKIDPRIE